MQNKNLIYIVGAVVVVIIILFALFGMQKSEAPGMSGSPQAANEQLSLKDLIGAGGSKQCSFTNTTDNANSSGVVYIANGKMRGDFSSTAGGKEIKSHMIVENNTSYVWSDAMPQGMKMSLDAMSAPEKSGTPSQNVDLNQRTNYSCNDWAPDQNVFSVPKNITFSDMSAMMQNIEQGSGKTGGTSSGDIKTMQCSACDQAPDAQSKAQCKIALGCK